MKYIAKMMLAALASITLAIPAYAWDWTVSGSASARFYNGSYTPGKDNDTATANSPAARSFNDMDHDGSISINANHTDGDTSASFGIGLNHDDGAITKSYSLSGSKKVGDWTASASYSLTEYSAGNSDSDDSDVGEGSDGEDALITLTDGSITYKLGKGAHLANSAKGPGTSFYNVHTDTDAGYEGGGGADTGSFDGFSVGMSLGDGMSATFAIQMDKDQKILGNRGWDDVVMDATDAGDNNQPWDNGTEAYDTMAYGVNLAGAAGTIDWTVTVTSGNISCDGATSDSGTDPACKNWSVDASSMALGVGMDMGGIKPFLGYASRNYSRAVGTGDANSSSATYTVMRLGVDGTAGDLSYSVGYDSTTNSRKAGTEQNDGTTDAEGFLGSDDDSAATAVTVSVSQAIGAVTLAAGVSSQLSYDDDLVGTDGNRSKTSNGSSLMVYGASLAYSF